MELLQNHPYNKQNPVKPLNFFQSISNLPSGKSLIVWIGIISFFFTGLVLYMLIKDVIMNEDISFKENVMGDPVFIGVLIVFFLSALIVFLLLKSERFLEIKEQQSYYNYGNISLLSDDQRKALRLDLVQVYLHGYWSETLEYLPCEVRVENNVFKPQTFDINNSDVYRQGLHKDWGIVSKSQYEKMIEDLHKGMHSKGFAYHIQSKEKEQMVEHLSGLIQKDKAFVWDCDKEKGGKPKKLIWGFDLWRAIFMSREAYMSGYITEDEAWKNILHTSSLIHYLFDDMEDFYDNYRLGNAYWSNDLDVTMGRRKQWEDFNKNCDWEIRYLPWNTSTKPNIPHQMKEGFATFVETELAKDQRNSIGFKKN